MRAALLLDHAFPKLVLDWVFSNCLADMEKIGLQASV